MNRGTRAALKQPDTLPPSGTLPATGRRTPTDHREETEKMKTRNQTPTLLRALSGVLLACAALCLSAAPALGQATSGGTQIQNRASATYSDGTSSYSVVSNTVTVTVANVTGLVITPDGGSIPTVVSGQTNVDFTFNVSNSGNFATQVRFPASGAAVITGGAITVTQAVIDINGNGIDAGDIDILGNGAPVLYPSSPYLARNASFNVIVRVSVNAGATAGSTVSVTLGDAAGDNQVSNGSAAEVRTSVPPSVTLTGSESEAVGSISTTVDNDAKLQAELTVPAGPVALGSNITYSVTLRNPGSRPVATQTLQGGPAGSNTGVFVVVPIPANTVLQSIPAPPAGVTVLYSVSALGADPGPGDPPASGPLSAAVVWTTTPPAVLSSTTRVAYRVNSGNPVAAAAVITSLDLVLTVSAGANASNPIYGIAEAFGRNSLASPITDQSDNSAGQVANKGDGNANFNEPRFGVDPLSATKGFQLPTTLTQVGNVLLGPSGAPAAQGPGNDNNLDYTDKSVAPAVIAGLSHLDTIGVTSLDFTNTVQNTGNSDDTFTLTAPTVPAGFTVQISTNGGTSFTTVSGGGSTTLAVPFGGSANFIVRVTTAASNPVLQAGGFSTTIRATSGVTNTQKNDTIDRLYTGFLKLLKSSVVINATGVGTATDPVPGADIEYTVTYSNVSVGGGGVGCVNLVASNIVISEDGAAAPNNWAANTTQITSPAPSDSNGGTITDGATNGAVTATSTFLKDAAGTLNPGVSKAFVFRRRIK
ncbi:MAG: hypothetical protein QOJ76_3228 [Acidobacteriota bacterium]|nr:hypothetical protein [Acidobacteriota bacterium]